MIIFSFIGGALLSLALYVGRAVYVERHFALTVGSLLWTALYTVLFTPVLTAALILLIGGIPAANEKLRAGRLERSGWNPANLRPAVVFFFAWAVLLLCWLPAYLAYFPGIWGYDMGYQVHQVRTGLYNTYQPLIHTLLYRFGAWLGTGLFGTATAGVAVFTALQGLLLSASTAGACVYLVKRLKAPFLIGILALAWYALLPFNAILAVSSTKDAVYSGLFLLLAVQFFDLFTDTDAFFHSWKRMGLFLLTVLFCCLLRNNMLYALALTVPFAILGVKQKRLAAGGLVLASLLLALAGRIGLSGALHAGSGTRAELLSVPMQQLGCVYSRRGAELTDEEKRELFDFLPENALKNYSPFLADPIKGEETIGESSLRIADFIKLWAKYLPRYLNDYTDAFLLMTAGYWYPDENFHSHIYDCYDEPDTEETLGYQYTGFMENIDPAVEKHSLWPGAERYYQWFAHGNNHEKIPVVSLLFAPGFYCWLLFIAVLALLYYRKLSLMWPLSMPCAVWLSLLLGPCVLVRYAYPLMALSPLLAGLLLNGREELRLAEPAADGGAGNGRGAEVLRFAVAGVLGFFIDYGCMVLFAEAFHMHYLLATALAFLISVVVNYLLCAYWVFQGADTKNGGVKAGFLITSAIGLGLNELIMYLLVDLLHIHYMIAKLIAVVLVMIWNYFSKRKVLVHKAKDTEGAA